MTAARRPQLEDLGEEYTIQRPLTMRRRALHQAEPMRLRGPVVDHDVYLEPRASWWWRAGILVIQTLAWATLVLTGVLCLVATLVFLWGVTQAFALLLRVLLGLAR